MSSLPAQTPQIIAFLPHLGTWEVILLLVLGLLIFGKRLPDVGKSLGKGIVEFKKGLKGIEEEVDQQASKPARRPELASENAYQAPLVDGADRRVSRADAVEEPAKDQ
ncbi:MAG: twin-arginine translocase TatA/TatE family subunit [Phycisphaerae bacterium]|nr:twin-arginine translocase TatA/TatE family subunit [Phycisphaerae bacterium]